MELTAVIKAFEDDVIATDSNVVVKSDSQLIINTMTKNWKKKENIELWDQLSNIIIKKNLQCDWQWVKAHAGIEGNENVDKKANAQARMTHLSINGDVNMVDVSDKKNTIRIAKATSKVIMTEEAFLMAKNNNSKKGNVTANDTKAKFFGQEISWTLTGVGTSIATAWNDGFAWLKGKILGIALKIYDPTTNKVLGGVFTMPDWFDDGEEAVS